MLLLDLENHSKTLSFPLPAPLKASYFQLYKNFCGIFPQFKAKFDTDKLLYQVPIS
jgi:hypothetical protein